MKISQVTDWADVAMRTGPFFFALLLFYLTWRFSHAAAKQGTTPAQQKLWPFLGVSSYLLAAATMIIAIVWWFKRPTLHVFEGSLRNLYSYEEIRSDEKGFFLRDELKQRFADEPDEYHDIHFVVVRDKPFGDGDTFAIDYRKKKGPRETLRIPFSSAGESAFKILWDESKARNTLYSFADEGPKGAWLSFFIRSAFAADMPVQSLPVDRVAPGRAAMPAAPWPPDSAAKAGGAPRPAAQRPPGPILNTGAQTLVAVLQDSRSEVGEKIAALDEISRYDASGISNLMKASTNEGPVAATLLDLSRHSDPELASKSRRVISRYDLAGNLARQIAASPASNLNEYAQILAAMDPAAAKVVLAKLSPEVRANVRPPDRGQPLPTGTASGDRYYVKVTWDRKNAAAVDCLTKTFNKTLAAHRTLAQEAALMRNRKDRLVFAYDRDWAVSLSSAIETCGAQATYVVPWKS